jgi:hypothetical protein
MSAKDTGGTAFPMQDLQAIHAYAQAKVELLSSARADKPLDTNERDAEYIQARAEAIGGMTVRDAFAKEAMHGAIAGHISYYGHESNHWQAKDIASYAYELADAMLEARKQ